MGLPTSFPSQTFTVGPSVPQGLQRLILNFLLLGLRCTPCFLFACVGAAAVSNSEAFADFSSPCRFCRCSLTVELRIQLLNNMALYG